MKLHIYILSLVVVAFAACNNQTENQETEEEVVETEEITGSVSFVNIKDGDTLASPFLLEMGVEGMIVEPKGEPRKGYGHHHLLINDGPIEKGIVIVADSTHIHYGGGQTSDSVTLAPGNYALTLQFADGLHVSYGEDWANTINVVVQ
jgi:hypothetical protein